MNSGLRGIERRRRQRRERERAGERGDRGEAAALSAPRAARAAGGGDEFVAELCQVWRQSHARYMGVPARLCQREPPQAAGTRTGNSRVSEPSPGRPLILQ